MTLRSVLLAAAFLVALVPMARPEGPALTEGHWLLATVGPLGEQSQCLLKAQIADGKTELAVVATPPAIEATVSEVKTDAGLSFKLKMVQTVKNTKGKVQKFTSERVFVAAPGADPKVILGSLGTDTAPTRAKLTPTDATKLDVLLARGPAADSFVKAQQLNLKVGQLRTKAAREKDADAKKDLRAQATKAQDEADEQLPVLFRSVVTDHADSPAALDAAVNLIRSSAKSKVTTEEATKLTALIAKRAAPYGPRYAQDTNIDLANVLVRQQGLEAVALIPIEPYAKALTDKDPLAFQFDTLTTYKMALAAAGRKGDLPAVEDQLAKLDKALDTEYLATVPPFKPVAFPGRNDSSANRVAVIELFTGAQCGPCIAADVAFDALAKAYRPTDLVLLQYHMHIPGPDVLTNKDTVGRWDYYTEMYPYDPETGEGVGGTPSTLFNGKPAAGGGGPMTNAVNKFDQYRRIIDPLLEKATPLKLTGTATHTGDTVAVAVDVSGVASADDLRLRILLVEDSVKYVGSNRIRFHHHVVRAMLGGADGYALADLKDGTMKKSATADLAAVRKDLSKYLDEYAATERPFPTDARPLDLKALKVMALVQNDKTREILQAVQIEVQSKAAGGE